MEASPQQNDTVTILVVCNLHSQKGVVHAGLEVVVIPSKHVRHWLKT